MKYLSFVFAVLCLFGCGPSLKYYEQNAPAFALEQYFDGRVEAWGIVENMSGQVTRRFTVSIDGQWKTNAAGLLEGTLDEHFLFDDGEKQFRQWRITRQAQADYIGQADDVIGIATGKTAGNTLHWAYVLRVPVDDTSYDLSFDDWMYRLDEKRVFNKATMSKFGLAVGEVTLFFEKR